MGNKELINNILCEDNVVESIESNLEGLLNVIPEIEPMIGFEHKNPYHHLNVWEHTMYALSFSPNNFDIRLTLLLHDIGKPQSYQEDNGRRHFKKHPEMSAKITNNILNRLEYDKEYIGYICEMVERHDSLLTRDDISSNPQMSSTIFEIQKCDIWAHNPEKNQKRLEYIQTVTELFNENESINVEEWNKDLETAYINLSDEEKAKDLVHYQMATQMMASLEQEMNPDMDFDSDFVPEKD